MHIKWIGIYQLPPLKNVSFDCDERVNLFIGPNASGKSTILRAMNSAWSGELKRSIGGGDGDLVFGSDKSMAYVFIDLSEDWPRDNLDEIIPEILIPGDTVPLFYAPTTRVSLPQQDIFSQLISHEHEKDDGDYVPYAPNYESPEAMFRTHFSNAVGSFDGVLLEGGIDWVRRTIGGNRNRQSQFRKALEAGYSCAKRICSEVIHDDVPHPYIELDEDHEMSDMGRIIHYPMGIGTSDDILSEPLYAGALSSGTQGTLLWVWALALKMAYHYNWTEGWEEKPAILLIDEIENHLHPTWQRRVIPALLEHFHRLQIFATAHSPFMVAGLKAGQVHLLKRDEDGSVTATTNERDVIGWTADEILRNMMGVEEPTDQLTVDRANRLRLLLEKETLTPEEEAELNRLRRQVNEDLLAKGGPLEVEQERYADLMRSFLLSRQSDLTQDGE